MPPRSFGRAALELRPVVISPNPMRHAEGSCQVEFGHTRVLVSCSVDEKVPPHVAGTGAGWLTAEYGMLPRATHERNAREAARGKQGGRTLEIQRLIGRSLRASIDLRAIGPRTLLLDCDVLQADGGTRTASITGAYVALVLALRTLHRTGKLAKLPATSPVAAVSIGLRGGEILVDLDYEEDSSADVDLNVVALSGGRLVEVQGTAERSHFDRSQLNALLDAGLAATAQLVDAQLRSLAETP